MGGLNPFSIKGGVVSRETQKNQPQTDNSSLIVYNQLMNRYYNAGRDCKNGLISKNAALFQFNDVVIQLGILRANPTTSPALRIQIDAFSKRVKNTITNIEDIATVIL